MATEASQSDCRTPLSTRNRSELTSDDIMLTQSKSPTPLTTLTPIRDLHPTSGNCLIRAKVDQLRKKDYKNGNGHFFEIRLLDCREPDVEIRAVAFNEVGNLLSPLLEEGKCYTIQHFTVKECNPQYPAKHQCELHFNNKTKVVEDPSSPSPEMENLSGSQTATPCTSGLQPTPNRAKSGPKGTSPRIIAKIQEYGPDFSAPCIRRKLLEDRICTNETLPSVSTINKYKRQSQDGAQKLTKGTPQSAASGQKRQSPAGLSRSASKKAKEATDQTDDQPKQQADEPQVRFAILTANSTEHMCVKKYLTLGDISDKIWRDARDCNCKNDPYLQKKNIAVTHLEQQCDGDYEMFQVMDSTSAVKGVHFSCTNIGPWDAFERTQDILLEAKHRKWPLKLICVLGCCGASISEEKKQEKDWHGTVLLTEQLKEYLNTGKAVPDGTSCLSRTHGLSQKWLRLLTESGISEPAGVVGDEYKSIPTAKVHQYLSGPLVIKEGSFADQIRDSSVPIAGIEMEVIGVVNAVKATKKVIESVCPGRLVPEPEVTVVKGISDYTGDKGVSSKSAFFGREIDDAGDNIRQQIATFNAIALLMRCVANNLKHLLRDD